MSWFNELLDLPIIYRMGWTLLHSLWQGSLLVFVAGLVLYFLRRKSPQIRYLLVCGALFSQLVLLVITFFLSSKVSLIASEAKPMLAAEIATASTFQNNSVQMASFIKSSTLMASKTSTDLLNYSFDFLEFFMPWIAIVWLCGVGIFSFWNLGGWIAVQRLKCLSTDSIDGILSSTFMELCHRMRVKQSVRLLKSALVKTPIVIGIIKPVILIPASFLTHFTPQQLEAILAHELAHIRRHDYLVNLFQIIAETILFYHPATWWLSYCIRMEREHCCDDIAIATTQARETYLYALASVAEYAITLAPAISGGSLLSRIKRLLGIPSNSARQWLAGASVMAALLAISFALYLALKPSLMVYADRVDSAKKVIEVLAEGKIKAIRAETLQEAIQSKAKTLIISLDDLDFYHVTDADITKLKEKKVIGMGYGAAQIFSKLGLEINHMSVMHFSKTKPRMKVYPNHWVNAEDFEDSIKPYSSYEGDVTGVHIPEKSERQTFIDVIGYWTEKYGKSWTHAPVVKQGNYILIGFIASANEWTQPFKAFFNQLSTSFLASRKEPFSVATWPLTKPGKYKFNFSKDQPGLTRKTFYFKFDKPVKFVADLEHEGSESMMLLFMGANREHWTRKDAGQSEPLKIEGDISENDIKSVGDRYWRLEVANFDSEKDVDCSVQIQY